MKRLELSDEERRILREMGISPTPELTMAE